MNGNQQHQHPQLKQAENKQPTKLAEEEDEFEEFKEHGECTCTPRNSSL